MSKNNHSNMQDDRPADVACSKCGRIIITAAKAAGMRERTIQEFVDAHRCTIAAESKRDFEDEVR